MQAGLTRPARPTRALLVALSLVLASSGAAVAQPQSPAPLPAVPVEAYPAAARDDIESAYRRALTHPNDAQAVGALAMLLQAWDEFEIASAAYARAQGLAPEAIDWWYLGGLTAHRRSLRTDAVRQFKRAAALSPDTPLVSLRLADSHLAAGDLEEARSRYRVLLTAPDCAPAAWYGLGRIFLMEKADGEARTAFEKALALYPDFGAAHYAMAQLQRRAGDAEGARRSLTRQQQCLACWPMPPDPWREKVEMLRDDAAALLTRGVSSASAGTAAANAEAIRLHEGALRQQSTRGQAHVNLIELYGRTGNAGAAQQHYRAALAEPGYAADAHRAYAVVLLLQQQGDEALALFKQAVALAPADAAAYHGMGFALEMRNQLADAADAYRTALRAAPNTRAARVGLARVLMRLKKPEEAIVHLEELREPRDAETAQYLFALSVAYVRTGRVEAARRAATEAIEVARSFGDETTAAAISAELRKLKPTP